jgi:hypothetical protein
MKDKVLKDYLYNDEDFKKAYDEYYKGNLTYRETIDDLIDYVLYSEFNPYLGVCYVDIYHLKDEKNDVIYNLDDIYEEYKEQIKESEDNN